jgi:hypothetical protein
MDEAIELEDRPCVCSKDCLFAIETIGIPFPFHSLPTRHISDSQGLQRGAVSLGFDLVMHEDWRTADGWKGGN